MSGDGHKRGSGDWTPKPLPSRRYNTAAIREEGDGWTVTLDDKPMRTPSKLAFVAPRPVAEAAAAEWAAQGERINPLSMPVTRAVNTAIERVAPNRDAVIAEIAGYGGTDLLCYRADAPKGLVAKQAEAWDPPLVWAARRFGARLILAEGVTPVAQSAMALAALESRVAACSDLELTALAELTALSGSLVLALAIAEGWMPVEAAWAAARVDEEWQISQWGRDAEAEAVVERRRADFEAAARLMALLRTA